MSSWICSAKHFNSIQEGIDRICLRNQRFFVGKELGKIFQWERGSKKNTEALDKVMSALRTINVYCVTLQYKHHYEGRVNEEIAEELKDLFANTTDHMRLTPIELVKALHSLRYQIEIEHLEEERELKEGEKDAMFFLEHIIRSLESYIVDSLPEYDKANTWCL